MANENTGKRFTDAIESITNVVNFELTLVDLDAQLQTDLSEEAFAARDKKVFLDSVRSSLQRVLRDIAGVSMARWRRVEAAFADRFPPAPLVKAAALDGGGDGETQCPPGFINEGGICVRIEGEA